MKRLYKEFGFTASMLRWSLAEGREIMNTSIVIIGAGGHAVSIANVAHGSRMDVVAFVDDNKVGTNL